MNRFLNALTHPWIRQRLIVAGVCLLCAALGVVWVVGYQRYIPWRLSELKKSAEQALLRGDYPEASLKARRALQLKADYAPAIQIMADLCEKTSHPDAATWQERITEMPGAGFETFIRCALVARKFGRGAVAERALNRVSPADRDREEYVAIAGAAALDAGKHEEAVRLFTRAREFNPEDDEYRCSLGIAQVASQDFFTRDAGRKALAALGNDEDYAVRALRALIASYEATGEIQSALQSAQKLAKAKGHTFLDDLALVRLLHATGDGTFPAALKTLKEEAAQDGRHAGALLVWMASAGLAAQGVAWAVEENPRVGIRPDVQQALGGCYLVLKDWEKLLSVTQHGNWGTSDYVRHAYRCCALRALGRQNLARSEWDQAMSAAAGRIESITWLHKIASDSQWPDETEEALWAAIEKSHTAGWAIARLSQRYHEAHNTDGLRRIAAAMMRIDPSDENAQNDFAFLSFLLDKETSKALWIAQELYKKHPKNPNYISTYALGLYHAKRAPEGLKILETLPTASLEDPAIALYYGVMLSVSDEKQKAKKFLEIAHNAKLLPEEANLLAKASVGELKRQVPQP